MLGRYLLLCLAAVASARLYPRAAPTVTIKNGTYSGYYAPAYGTDNFLGVPYAQPPVGNLRFRVPQSLNTTWNGVRSATEYSPECFGYGLDTRSQGNIVSEDCLYLNIVRPTGVKGKLPVGFWIHGGGLVMGGGPDNRYNLSFIVQQSVEAGSPIIGVSINYRLSAWGFLYSNEIQKSGNTMLGYRDQRLALQWLQDNIAAFGGDPSQVTIWGESSGGSSVGALLLAYNGRNDGLFARAVAQSGPPVSVRPYPSADSQQRIYDNVTKATGCYGSSDSLQCLRTIPTDKLNSVINSTATNGASYGTLIDGDMIQQPASVQLQNGNFVKVPFLIGCNADEGTASGTRGINTTAEYLNWLSTQGFDNTTNSMLSYLYPDIPDIGVPSTIKGRPPSILGAQYKRVCATSGDIGQHAPRRLAALAWAAQNIPLYSYQFDVLVNGQPYTNGAVHFQEVAFVFYNTEGYGYPQNLNPNPMGGVNRPQYLVLAKLMTRMWIGFISNGDPNSAVGGLNAQPWPKYTLAAPKNYLFDANQTSRVEDDTYRAEAINFIMDLILARKGQNCTSLDACNASSSLKFGDTTGTWGW